MISETFIPLYQFARWLGLNGYDVSGIEQDECPKCCCALQHSYQKPSHWSRDCMIDALSKAEDIITTLFNVYPNRYQIEDEQHKLNGFRDSDGRFTSYRPFHPVKAFEYGLHSVDFLETSDVVDWKALTVANNNKIPKTVDFTFALTGLTVRHTAKHFRLYYTSVDLPDRDTSFNSHYGEIRPFKNFTFVEIDNLDGTYDYNITLEVDTFLLNSPTNLEADSCCKNVVNLEDIEESSFCYITELDLFVESPDCCGYLVTENSDCSPDCTEQRQCVCVYQRKIRDELWFVPNLHNCETDSPVCLTKYPDRVSFNYLTGFCPNDNKYVDKTIARIVFMLAVSLADCIHEGCDCDICFKAKLKYYREADQYQIRLSVDNGGEYDEVNEILKDKFDADIAKGLMQNRGVLTAFAMLRNLKPNPIGVSYGI